MSWLLLIALATASSVFVLMLANAYLYFYYKKPFIKIWAAAWGIYSLRYLSMVIAILWKGNFFTSAAYYLSIVASAVLLLIGTMQFIGRSPAKWPVISGILIAFWTVGSLFQELPIIYVTIPVFSFVAFIGIFIGYQILIHVRRDEIASRTIGWLFIAWGIHQADYPLLSPIKWFAPWGFLIGSSFAVSIAIGMILIYFERTHKALQEKEELYRNLIDSSHDMIWEVNAEAGYTYINLLIQDILGYTPEEALGKTPFDFMPEPDASRFREAFAEVSLKRAQFHRMEINCKHKDGRNVVMETSGVPFFDNKGNYLGYRGINQDISERKQAETAIMESEERFRSYISNSPHAILVADENGFYKDVNPAACAITGYSAEELLTMKIPDLLPPESLQWATNTFEQVVNTGRTYGDAAYKKKNGEIGFWSLAAVKLSPTRYLGFVTDITERKRAEEVRDQLERQLLHAQKLESLGVLAGGIAHDFNNILMAIIGNADLALMRINKESPGVDNLHKIEEAAARAADLAKQMLAYSGKGKFVVEHINLNRLLEDMLHMLEVSISKKAVLRLNLIPNLPSVEADATQMRQIVMNLVINASEAIGDKSGVIAITTGCMDCDKDYLKDVWLYENISGGLYVYLEIADSGCGMDKETMARIFDPFFTTKFTGRGLGMAAVLGIVRGHKGAIKVYSELGKGTTFKILLPASDKPAEIFNRDSHADDWKGSGIVLLVDDEESVRGIGKEMLQELGFTALTANDGREAIEMYKQNPDISFVILDLTMPHIDGEQCFRQLKQLNPDIKVIMSSGYNEQEVTQKFVGKGLAGFVQKPYKLSVLKEAAKNI
jgi:PAS domain S-box-containing protein